ncbi:MAG: archaeosortase/exosortase family protein [Chloroflexi bacterium]|nr:archaeosortase/exosortase family protein [Chloroflexota bacterium]
MRFASKTNLWLHNGNSEARFCFVFFSCIVTMTVVYIGLRNNSILDPLLNLNAWLATSVWNIFGNSAQTEGVLVTSNKFCFEVTAECTSIIPAAILISAIIAWPSTTRERLYGVMFGIVALFITNQVRILTLFYIGSSYPNYLDIAHYYIWQGLVVMLALGLWLFWTEKLVHINANKS